VLRVRKEARLISRGSELKHKEIESPANRPGEAKLVCEPMPKIRHGLMLIESRLSKDYCLEPVVLLFGFGEQLRFCGFASFSQAAMLAYLQLSPPLAEMLMQKGELPTVDDFCMVVPDEGEPIVPCACAKDTPAMSAAMAVKVANVFIV
jgi:hypothetical protein